MKDKLEQLFRFLKENREYNYELQEKYYRAIIIPYDNVTDKVTSLLYHIANTQSQPNIDKLAVFYKNIYKNIDRLNTFTSFLIELNNSTTYNYKELFECMKHQPGWGQKTAALFSKSIYHLHNSQYSSELKIWDDVPNEIAQNDKFYLPVDAVITPIFKNLDSTIKWDFDKINQKIGEYYKGQEIELWDDLWFWGFITQKGSGINRIFEWNENKYWALYESNKDRDRIKKIKSKAIEFLEIINQ